ncbi:TIGR01621 family pseudouridine synthase [Pseudomaricurvus sp. HS19]|uniref:TIGR01621 family pseudouridine synthase n=1 Tax=Pseudomaricurvus sp. HS19 TaxID=2692626 RepID=UPI001369462C|nr:TIGR01621 family pseudouridine synthase [Pseudomaricurvus sp. HS19]MYM62301.1 TIGR01621 family pseudouridine synthase [Pseudomaricurvus sp. HS19]
MNYSLLDHNADFVVVNKGSSIEVHNPQHPDTQAGVSGDHGLLAQVARDLGLERVYPVHRLDRGTSGVMIMACHAAANRQLSMAFAARQVQKFYLAVSDSRPAKKQGLVAGDMEKARRGSWKLAQSRHNPAATQFFSKSLGGGKRLFLLKPCTGKTHQLRVMMKAIGAPILGDSRYGGSAADRMYLHAWQLQFPWQGQARGYAALPESGAWVGDVSLTEALAEWQEPMNLSWPKLPPGLVITSEGAGKEE